MSTAEPTPGRGEPSPGTAVDEAARPVPEPPAAATPPAERPEPAGEQVAPAGEPTSGAQASPAPRQQGAALAQGLSRAGQQAQQVVSAVWQRGTPAARWVTDRTASLTQRAARVNLVQVAAGVAVTALAAVVIALAAQVHWEVGVLSAPLWLFVGASLLAGTVLGPWRSLLAVSLYLVLGLVGAAWSGDGVAAHLEGPWAGVLLSLPVAGLVTGAISARHSTLRSPVTSSWYFFGWFFFAALTGFVVVYAGGLYTLFDRAEVDGWTVFITMSARLPFDAAQCVLVATIAAVVHRLVPGLLRSTRRRRPASG